MMTTLQLVCWTNTVTVPFRTPHLSIVDCTSRGFRTVPFHLWESRLDRDERSLTGDVNQRGHESKNPPSHKAMPDRQGTGVSSPPSPYSALISGSADGLIILMRGDLEKVLFDEPAIHRRLDDMAAQISNDYRDRELTVIAVLHGSLMFVADLLRRIPLPLKLDCLSVASYHGKVQSSGEVVFKLATAGPAGGGQSTLADVAGRDILVLDDVLDSGFTLAAVRGTLETARPHSIRTCVLLSKRKQRAREVDADYVGFEIEDEFVVGYGLDFRERYRNLPYIGVLRRELLEQPGK